MFLLERIINVSHELNRRDVLSRAACALAMGTGGSLCAAGAHAGETEKPESGSRPNVGGYCGIYCGSCALYLQSVSANDPSEVKCMGCKSGTVAPHCQKCPIKDCASKKGLDSCGECDDFPCDKTKKFHGSGRDFAFVAEKNCYVLSQCAYTEWLKTQQTRWSCVKCGTTFSNRVEECPKCQSKVYSCAEEAAAFRSYREAAKG